MKRKVLKITKTKIVLKVSDLLEDMFAGITDEELLDKYSLDWVQLSKVYEKLFYGGYMSKAHLQCRYLLRQGKNASHIPFIEISEDGRLYECLVCGYASQHHFSSCPRCRQINLRRLYRRTSGFRYYRGAGSAG